MELDVENLDNLITLWRDRKKAAIKNGDIQDDIISSCYVDAYQTVRVNNGLPLLPQSEITKDDVKRHE